MAKIEGFGAPGAYDPPTYTQAIKVTEAQTFLFLSGQTAREPDGSLAHPGDFAGQARTVLQAVQALVEAGGGTLDNLVKVNAYIADVRYREAWQAIYREFFPRKLPAYTVFQVSTFGQPGWLIEVEAIAVL